MHIIGITGGVGSGKSEVLSYLREAYGAYVLQLDLVARALQQKGEEVLLEIVKAFGPEVLYEDGSLNRAALGELVFGDEFRLKILNQIVHPAVKRRVLQEIEQKKAEGCGLFFLEAALFLPEQYGAICEELWYIYTKESVRRQRLLESRGYSEEKMDRMIASQPTEDEFLSVCDVTIDNSSSFSHTKEQLDKQLGRIRHDEIM